MPDKKKEATLKIDLYNYPHILKQLTKNGPLGGAMLKEWLTLLDDYLAKDYHAISDREFGLSLVSLINATVEAHFDYKGITAKANNPQEAAMLAVLKWENNPLSFITGGKQPVNLSGEPVSLREFLGVNKIDVKDYLQSLLYGARYMDAATLVNYMSLGKFDLMPVEKSKHIDKLLEIQPALAYQKEHDIVVGRFVPGTGFFDCGTADLEDRCPACKMKKEWLTKNGKGFCLSCKAAFEQE